MQLATGRTQGGFGRSLAAIAGFGLVVRVVYLEVFASHLQTGLDTIWYQLQSATLASGVGYVDPGRFFGAKPAAVATAFRPPLYPVFLAGVSKIFDGSTRTFQLAGCLAGVATIVLVGFLGRRVGGSTVGLVAAALASLYPVFLGIDTAVMSETLYVPLVAGCVLAAYRLVDRPSVPRAIVVGGTVAAAILTRGDAVLLVVLVLVPAAMLASAPPPRRALLAATSICTCALVVTPWMVRNEREVGVGTVATLQSGTALAGANCADTYSGRSLGSWSFACTQRPGDEALSERRLNEELRRDGKEYMLHHLARVPVVVSARVLRQWALFDPVGQARLDAIESRNVRWQLASWLAYLPVGALALYGFVLLRRRRVLVAPMLGVVVAVTLSGAAVYGGQRLRSSVEPMLVVAAAVAIVSLAGGRRPTQVSRPEARWPRRSRRALTDQAAAADRRAEGRAPT